MNSIIASYLAKNPAVLAGFLDTVDEQSKRLLSQHSEAVRILRLIRHVVNDEGRLTEDHEEYDLMNNFLREIDEVQE